ncbi:MAG: LysM peptidoglycan-binding domain-containing protein [Bergeyella zoohelcum]|nr:LysM peptidoglycan-binding domain-containing protein [Bergeyella zoohelcum]
MLKKISIISTLSVFFALKAQQTHKVTQGDTAYSIAKKYKMSFSDLAKLNSNVADGKLNIGDEIIISKKANSSAVVKNLDRSSTEIGYIVLQPKQTIYGITKQYKISEAELRKLNPDLESKMKIGNQIALPLDNIKKYGDGELIAERELPLKQPAIKIPSDLKAIENQQVDKNSYLVQAKDNYYKITRKYNITQEQLFAMNPGLEQKGLQVGDVIKVKGSATPTKSTNNVVKSADSSSDNYVTHVVKSDDTIFSIVNKYGVSLDELLKLNPELSSGLKTGMVLKIKKYDAQYVKKSGDALNVVMMLPFGFDSNDSKFRSLSTDFLLGAKLAIERNAKRGQKLSINVVDAGNEASFKNSLSQINKDNTDLIIGPLFKSNVEEVLHYVGDKKIPVVAPFANSEELYGYDNLIIVETNDGVYAERIADEVKKIYSDEKIYIVADTDKTYADSIKSTLEKSLKGAKVSIVASPSEIQLEKNMMTGKSAPVVAILASKNDNTGAAFTKKVMEISKEVSGNKAFSMYYHSSFEKNVDALSQANLVYIMDRKINTEGSFEKEILAEYQKKYCKAPSKYAVIGFDVVNDILTRENKSGEVFKQMAKTQTHLATKFEYVRAKKNGAYINTGYRVVRLVP